MSKTTIADVARLARVSTSSVSNVLNGRSQRMRPATQERIEHAMQQLGYTPNLAARQLKTGHSPFIGLIVPSVADPFFGFLARLVEEAAMSEGYQVLLGNSDRDPERERKYAEVLWGIGIRGIIFGSTLASFPNLQSLIQKGMHIITFCRPAQHSDQSIVDSIGVDNFQATRLITKHLLSLGHRRIGFISGPIDMISRIDRLKGFQDSLRAAGIEPDPLLVWGETTETADTTSAVELGRQGAHYLLSLPDPPSAIVAISDMHAFGVYAGARDLGMGVPDDISVTGIDDINFTEVVEPSLTTAQQPLREITRLAVERLVSRLENDDISQEPVQLTLSPKLIVRGSTARYLEKEML